MIKAVQHLTKSNKRLTFGGSKSLAGSLTSLVDNTGVETTLVGAIPNSGLLVWYTGLLVVVGVILGTLNAGVVLYVCVCAG